MGVTGKHCHLLDMLRTVSIFRIYIVRRNLHESLPHGERKVENVSPTDSRVVLMVMINAKSL